MYKGQRTLRSTAVLLLVGACPVFAGGGGPAFEYQGQLKQDGAPANGQFDFRFSLQTTQFGVVLPPPQCRRGVTVVNGLFTTEVEFPPGTFVGPQFSLQVHVKPFVSNEIFDCIPNTFDPFTAVGPPQPIQPTPYAMFAQSAPPGSSLDAPDGSPIDALVVDNVGNVVIGNLTQPAFLSVTGGIIVSDPDGHGVTLASDLIQFVDASDQVLVYEYDGAANSHSFSTGGTPRVFIGNGRVGINTTNPLTELHVFDAGAARMTVESATGQAGIALISDSTGENVLYSPNNTDDLRFFMGTADRMAITSLGNVGIGTNVPLERLHVEGSVVVTGGIAIGETTRFVSLSAADFAPASNSKLVSEGGGPMLLFGDAPATQAIAYATVHLPDGAVIREFTAHLNDSNFLGDDITVSLRRRDVLAAGVATIASVNSFLSSGQFQARSTTSVSFPTVNNQGFTYFVQATWGGAGIRLAGAQIEYTVTSPLP